MRTAKIIKAEKVEKTNKLIKMEVELDGSKRQIVSGIAEHYDVDDLIGKTKNPDELRKLLKEALDNGAIDTSTIAQELQQVIPELMGSAKVAGRTLYEGKTSDQIFQYLFELLYLLH